MRATNMSRRSFAKGAAGALVFSSLSGCAAASSVSQGDSASAPAAAASVTDSASAPAEVASAMDSASTSTAASAAAASPTSPESDSSGFVLLADAVPDVIQEIRYYTTYNFVGERIDGYEQPVALITREAGAALAQASDLVKAQGYRLKVFDAYRPQKAVDHFVRWSKDSSDVRMKEYFYPELDKSVLFEQEYIMEKSGHTRGSTVDLTLFDMKTEREADAGGTFDYFGELSHPDYRDITEEQYAVRMTLRDAMVAAGFRPLDSEWWHFTLEDEPYPDTYFTFPVSISSLTS